MFAPQMFTIQNIKTNWNTIKVVGGRIMIEADHIFRVDI